MTDELQNILYISLHINFVWIQSNSWEAFHVSYFTTHNSVVELMAMVAMIEDKTV
jgi:hypothetical protein